MAIRPKSSTPRSGAIRPPAKPSLKTVIRTPVQRTDPKPKKMSAEEIGDLPVARIGVKPKGVKHDKRLALGTKKPKNKGDNLPKGVPFIKLFANASVTDIKYVKDVAVESLKKARYKGWPGYAVTTTTVDGKKRARRYKCIVVAKDEAARVHRSKEVFVMCTCDRQKFYYEYALTQRGASEIKYSNGEYPAITNPRLYPSACKHLLRAMHTIKTKNL